MPLPAVALNRYVDATGIRTVIRGLLVIPHFVTASEESFLLQQLDDPECPQPPGISQSKWMHEPGQRQIRQFGARYDFLARALAKAEAIPMWMKPICRRVETTAGFGRCPNQVIANAYPSASDGIDVHLDHQLCFGPVVASLSFLSSTVMTFRHGHKSGDPLTVLLEARSLLVLAGEARYEWYHEIGKGPEHLGSLGILVPKERRISLTFRTIDPGAPWVSENI